jgi:hypothetical protein
MLKGHCKAILRHHLDAGDVRQLAVRLDHEVSVVVDVAANTVLSHPLGHRHTTAEEAVGVLVVATLLMLSSDDQQLAARPCPF